MGLTIQQKADTLATWRHVSVKLMELLAAWVPTSPELEVKTLFGQHIWMFAQHANALGYRTVELRAKLHYDREPLTAYGDLLRRAAAADRSGDRVAAVYDAILPDLAARLRRYASASDELLDGPTLAIIDRMLADYERASEAYRALGEERPDITANPAWLGDLRAALAGCTEMVSYRQEVA